MDQNYELFPTFNTCTNQNSISSFNMEVLLSSIANNDSLVRSYHAKCAELDQSQQSLQSLSETANQIRQMYATEKERKEQLQLENQQMCVKIKRFERDLEQLENDRINHNTLSKQTIAELELNLRESNEKHIALCETFVEQADILQANGLSTPQITRKSGIIKELLNVHGIECAISKSPTKPRKRVAANRSKAKAIQSVATMTEIVETVAAPTRVQTCDKGTQYQQSKATRSTCTSAFIRLNDAATNTDGFVDNDRESQEENSLVAAVENILEEMRSVPASLSPIHETQLRTIACSTQTTATDCRTQGTITVINNVRKQIDYVRSKSPSSTSADDALSKVKKEDNPIPLGLMPNYLWSELMSRTHLLKANAPNDPSLSVDSLVVPQLNPQLIQIWHLLGQMLFTIVGQGNTFADEKRPEDIRLIEKIHEISSIIDQKATAAKKLDENVNLVNEEDDTSEVEEIFMNASPENVESIDCLGDEHSRDSIESYNSGKLVISKMRNLTNCSPFLDENSVSSIGEEHFRPINSNTAMEPSNRTDLEKAKENANKFTGKKATNSMKISRKKAHKSVLIRPVSSIVATKATSQSIEKSSLVQPSSESCDSDSNAPAKQQMNVEISGDCHFKVPKRKSASNKIQSNSKRKKITQVTIRSNSFNLLIFNVDRFFSRFR